MAKLWIINSKINRPYGVGRQGLPHRAFALVVFIMASLVLAIPGQAQPSEGEVSAAPEVVTETPAQAESTPVAEAPKVDTAAQLFMMKCAGCHTVGGGQLTGPDLRPVQTWPRQNVDPAIQRMEKSVGPLPPEEIATLAELLQSPSAPDRLSEERKRIALAELATLDPPDAAAGEAVFFGRQPLVNRGLACAACHAVHGRGGNLASDLTGSFAKLGAVPLASSIEGTTFPLMKAAYAANAITKQEAIHLVKYLEAAGAQPAVARGVPPLHAIGVAGVVIAFLGMTRSFRKRNRGVRAALVRNAMRRSRS